MEDRFDPRFDTTYLQYLDANNLYGWAMSQPLSAGGFKWVDVNPNEISELHYPHSSIETSATTWIEARWNPSSDRIRSITMVKNLCRL